jgi:hypothetical protein
MLGGIKGTKHQTGGVKERETIKRDMALEFAMAHCAADPFGLVWFAFHGITTAWRSGFGAFI